MSSSQKEHLSSETQSREAPPLVGGEDVTLITKFYGLWDDDYVELVKLSDCPTAKLFANGIEYLASQIFLLLKEERLGTESQLQGERRTTITNR